MKRKIDDDIPMAPDKFRAALDKIGISQSAFARLINRYDRTVRTWVSGEYPVPREIALLVNLMIKTKTKPEDLRAN